MSTVTEHLTKRGITFELLPHPPAQSAHEEARLLDLSPLEVLKVLVLDTHDGHAIAVLPSHRRLDLARARSLLADQDVHLASEAEMAEDLPEFELGAVPAVPELVDMPVLIDPEVFRHRRVTFSAGTQDASVRVDPRDVLRGASVTIAPITRSFDDEADRRW